jgi:CubicO group peptidase (beta-lactamase class C family)
MLSQQNSEKEIENKLSEIKNNYFFKPHDNLKVELKPQVIFEQMDNLIITRMDEHKIPGLSIAIIKNGEIIKAQGYGFANLEHKVKSTVETIYQSASVGKQFTATLIMMLCEEKLINLDNKICTFFSESPASWSNITVRHLLSHTSGIRDYLEGDINYKLDYSEEQLLHILQSYSLNFEPGEEFCYSSSGYVLLGMIIKKVTGKFYGDLLKERIFDPLGMKTACVIDEADIIHNRAAGYRLLNGILKNQEYVSPSLNKQADGSLYFSVLDLAKWDAALYTEKLMTRSTLKMMYSPIQLNNGEIFNRYGFGWELGNSHDGQHHFVRHSGFWQGFKTGIVRFPDDKMTFVVLYNCDKGNPLSLCNEVSKLFNPRFDSLVSPLPNETTIQNHHLNMPRHL